MGALLSLQRSLGLRFEEAAKLDAQRALAQAERHGQIRIEDGTKGGLVRQVPCQSPAQHHALAQAAAQQEGRSLIPPSMSYKDFRTAAYSELRSAGIRLIRFKGALASWPQPDVLRERVLTAVRPTPTGFGASGYATSGFARSGYEPSGFAPSGFTPSGFEGAPRGRAAGAPASVLSLTDLAGLEPANQENPWQGVRKRS